MPGHVFKPEYTTAIPASAKPFTMKDGTSAVKWKGRAGVERVGILCGDPKRCRVQSSKWYARYQDESGQWQEKPGFTDKGATEALLAKLVQQSARVASGLLPPEAIKPRRTMPELLDSWRDYLRDDGSDEKHYIRQRARVDAIRVGINAERPADFTPSRVSGWVAKQRRDDSKRFGSTTAYHYLGAAKAFTRWLAVTERYEPVDHLSALTRTNDESGIIHVRRVLSASELEALFVATRKGGNSRGLTGPERAALYVTAASTGLRASELASLTVTSFDLDAEPPTVDVEAAYAKNRRKDELYIPDSLLGELRAFLKGRKGVVWPDRSETKQGQWWNTAAKMLRGDLAAAGIPYADDRGRVFDFHALRSQFITDLDRAGVSLGRAQKLARHSTPLLTSKFYTRPEREELANEVNKLKR